MCFFFFFNDTATTEIYTLSLHDALPISALARHRGVLPRGGHPHPGGLRADRDLSGRHLQPADALQVRLDRKSTRLNSSHGYISYAVFCLKKKKKKNKEI